MTTFIPASFSSHRSGVDRRESTGIAVRRGFDSTKGLSAMLLAAMVSALVVVTDQLMDTSWAEGHLMVAWIALWVVGFTAAAVFAGAARKLASTLVEGMDAWSAGLARNRADQRLWATALADPRVMSDLTAALARGHGD